MKQFRFLTVEFWAAILGALVAIGFITMDVPGMNETAESIVGGLGVIVALIARIRGDTPTTQ